MFKSFWTIATLVVGLSTATAYAFWSGTGRELSSHTERVVPKDVRASPTGYRGFHFWHFGATGFRGGK